MDCLQQLSGSVLAPTRWESTVNSACFWMSGFQELLAEHQAQSWVSAVRSKAGTTSDRLEMQILSASLLTCQEAAIVSDLGITSGNWSLEVTAVDAAGNSATTPLMFEWTVALEPDLPYARFLDSPLALTGTSRPHFSFQVSASRAHALSTLVAETAQSSCVNHNQSQFCVWQKIEDTNNKQLSFKFMGTF